MNDFLKFSSTAPVLLTVWLSIQPVIYKNKIPGIINSLAWSHCPLAMMNSGFLWPVEAWKELTTGDLLASDDDVTVSPR